MGELLPSYMSVSNRLISKWSKTVKQWFIANTSVDVLPLKTSIYRQKFKRKSNGWASGASSRLSCLGTIGDHNLVNIDYQLLRLRTYRRKLISYRVAIAVIVIAATLKLKPRHNKLLMPYQEKPLGLTRNLMEFLVKAYGN